MRGSGRAERTQADRLLDFFLLEKAFYEIEYELAHRPDWLHVPLAGTWRILSRYGRDCVMSELPREAYAIIEGRHSDPFHYLGLHVGERRRGRARLSAGCRGGDGQSTSRAMKASCIASTTPACLPGAWPTARSAIAARALRRRRGRDGRSLSLSADPVRFRSLSARRRHAPAALREARRASDDARGRRRRGLRGVRPRCQARQRGRRFQFLGRPAACDARARQRLLGNLRPGRQGRRPLQIRDRRGGRPDAAAEVRSGCLCRRGAAADRVDRRRSRCGCRALRPRRQASTR